MTLRLQAPHRAEGKSETPMVWAWLAAPAGAELMRALEQLGNLLKDITGCVLLCTAGAAVEHAGCCWAGCCCC